MIKGIDVSSHNGWPFNSATQSAYNESDFIIIKATEGTSYVNPYCDKAYQQAKKDGKLLGVYHYASGGNARTEAEYFFENIKGYIGEAIPVIDWESYTNDSWGSTSWVYTFVTRFHELSGVYPMIYIQASAIGQAANCSSLCALWIAGYPDYRTSWDLPSFNYSTSPWSTWTVWQYTSGGGVDRNYAQVSSIGWKLIAAGGNSSEVTKPENNTGSASSSPSGTTAELAAAVISGAYGNGDARKNALGSRYDEVQNFINKIYSSSNEEKANDVIAGLYGNGDTRKTLLGSSYDAVQDIVNQKLGAGKKSVAEVAKDVIAGKYGNGDARKRAVEAAGYNYDEVQAEVNKQLGASSSVYYTVQSGDTLSGIASKYGTTWQSLQSLNGISDANKIYSGQVIRIK